MSVPLSREINRTFALNFQKSFQKTLKSPKITMCWHWVEYSLIIRLLLSQRPNHFGLELYKYTRKAICVYFDEILSKECLFKDADGILSFAFRSNPPPNLFRSYITIWKSFILYCAFGKVKSKLDSDIRIMIKTFDNLWYLLSNLFLTELIFLDVQLSDFYNFLFAVVW